MNPTTSGQCPFHAKDASPTPAAHPRGIWPPGPSTSLTGWSLLARMSRDLLGTLAAWQREFGDVVHLRFWPEHEIVVSDPTLVRELLVTHHDALVRWERGMHVFAQLHGHSVLIAEGEAWRGKRHAMQPNFSPKAVQAFVPTISAATEKALAQWPKHDMRWPIESAITSLAMDVITRMMFSSEIGEEARIAEQAIRVVSAAANAEFYWPASSPDWVPWKRAKRRARAALHGLIDRHLQARLAQPQDAWPDDLLTRLLQLHRDAPTAWPLHAVRDECMTAFLAGHETTAATLIWWAWCMASNPAAQALARREVQQTLQGRTPSPDTLASLPYLTQTIKETLRLYPAAPVLVSRRSTRPITLGTWQLPARTMFLIPVQVMHHDPRWFPEPLAFRPERFALDALELPRARGAYLPFGTGPRVCLGQHLAMSEMTVIAAMLLQRFTLSVPDNMQPPRPVMNVTLRPDQPLHLAIAPA
ncbi:cytochrome P450 [Ralstonia insidiosa]|uniref:Cytochrome P450 n=2 Tax=Ralstonia insidiosa TaxID=190721 RepID=A0A191ZYL0_9RALS|nr:cytochrome P450 [Ralstonia insidiosa]ANJ73173.1 cytochrome P450 [Ralstonia insidiosa]KAB0473542.1 cytochrome P450 [Ralstonia insidiosa]MBY4911372.1 cytochrome P450 [Ralstonia insidiosa]